MLVGINAQKLFVTQDYRNAGVSTYIRGIVSHLGLVPGNERYLLYTNPDVHAWPQVESNRMRIERTPLPTLSPTARILWEQIVLPALAIRDRIDLLHCPLNVQPVVATCPVVLTIHDLTFVRFPDRFGAPKRNYLTTLTRYSARRARRILADSAATKADVVQAFQIDPGKIDVVYPACDPDFRPFDLSNGDDARVLEAFRRKYSLPARFILYLGTLEPRKNVDRLLSAYANLVRRGIPHHLVLAGGKGWMFESIFRAVETLGLQSRVHFPGYVTREEQPLWYNSADLFTYPSQYEGFGLPPLEAMACGVPVVTSQSSSLPEVVGSAGRTVNVDDVEALTEAMAEVLYDPHLAEGMRGAGLEQAATFTWEKAAHACVTAYRSAMNLPLREDDAQ